MAYIRQISEENAEGLLKKIYTAAKERVGSVANIIRVMSQDPKTTNSSMQFYTVLMKNKNALSNAQKEMLATVVSNINDCYY